MENIVQTAQDFAHYWHDYIHQKRKYSGAPYWVHTDAVAATVAEYGKNRISEDKLNQMVAAAHLHDTLEDVYPVLLSLCSPINQSKFFDDFNKFPQATQKIVRELTDKYTKARYPDLNRAERHTLENERLKNISFHAKIVKLADLKDNTADIAVNDPNFAKVYLKEKCRLIEIFRQDKALAVEPLFLDVERQLVQCELNMSMSIAILRE